MSKSCILLTVVNNSRSINVVTKSTFVHTIVFMFLSIKYRSYQLFLHESIFSWILLLIIKYVIKLFPEFLLIEVLALWNAHTIIKKSIRLESFTIVAFDQNISVTIFITAYAVSPKTILITRKQTKFAL